ncbi:MAG: UPF0149 family protein [Aquisalimonadaceae bacterium]
MNVNLPDFHDLDTALAAVGAHMGAAESQGLLCGLVSARADADAAHWIAQVLEDAEPKGDPARTAVELLAATWQETLSGLEDSNLGLALLLPDDAVTLPERAVALGQWCQGFLYGVGQADQGKLPEQVREVVLSLADIARIDSENTEEADEDAYAELVEFVRVAALLVREHLLPAARGGPVDIRLPSQGPGSTLH